MRQLDANGQITNKKFNFEVSTSHQKNQNHYEMLGEVINEHVYELLEQENLYRLYFPENASKETGSFVFCTQDIENIKDIEKLIIIIHGSGVVRAGQWARSLIINDSLEKGTIFPYIKKAKALGFDILVTNTNNKREGSKNPEQHAENVWRKFVQTSAVKKIAIVAHSYGGIVTVDLASKFKQEFDKKVFAVAFTDSVHGARGMNKRLLEIGINFVSSDEPLNTKLQSSNDVERRSAGTSKHELTSYQCMNELFEFISQKEKEFNKHEEL